MKNYYFKILGSVTAIIFAITLSFISYAAEISPNRTTVTAYISPVSEPPICSKSVLCSDVPSANLCYYNYLGLTYQAFSKVNPNDTNCTLVRYRLP